MANVNKTLADQTLTSLLYMLNMVQDEEDTVTYQYLEALQDSDWEGWSAEQVHTITLLFNDMCRYIEARNNR